MMAKKAPENGQPFTHVIARQHDDKIKEIQESYFGINEVMNGCGAE